MHKRDDSFPFAIFLYCFLIVIASPSTINLYLLYVRCVEKDKLGELHFSLKQDNILWKTSNKNTRYLNIKWQ